MFMLIIWLQGIWLPLHGYDFNDTPLYAGIYMLPLTVGMLLAGPTSGYLSDRFGARGFATGGMIGAAVSFFLLTLLPTDFSYPVFALFLFMNGVSMGMFASPNRAGVMNSLPPGDRGARSLGVADIHADGLDASRKVFGARRRTDVKQGQPIDRLAVDGRAERDLLHEVLVRGRELRELLVQRVAHGAGAVVVDVADVGGVEVRPVDVPGAVGALRARHALGDAAGGLLVGILAKDHSNRFR